MKDPKIYIILSILLLIAIIFIYQYIFGIYEVTYSVDHRKIFADNQSTATITVVPVNSFGWKAPLRSSPAKFRIVEGADLVEIIQNSPEKGFFSIKAKDKPGKVIIWVKSIHSLLPSEIEIIIEPNLV